MAKNLTEKLMLQAFEQLDKLLKSNVQLIVGGGGAMILAHQFPLATTDIDAIPKGIEIEELDPLIKKVAQQLDLPVDWLNPYFSTFTLTLPNSFRDRLCEVYQGSHLQALALGKEDMLIMKCFAHRLKDIGHAKSLIKQGVDVSMVEEHILSLQKKAMKGATEALDFLDQVREDL